MIDFTNVQSIVIPEGEVAVISRGGEILWQKSKLPFEYQEVEYIESTGTQFINTGFKPDEHSKMYLDFYPTKSQSTCYAGCRNGESGSKFTINSGSGAKNQYGGLGDSGNVTVGAFRVARHTETIENGVFTYDGAETIVSSTKIGTMTARYTVYLFACNTNGATLQSSCRIYSCKIWDDGVLVFDFVPCCRKSDGEPGMYNLVTKKFFTNAGSGEFLYPSSDF